jgi:hypothetical protein
MWIVCYGWVGLVENAGAPTLGGTHFDTVPFFPL